MDSDRESDERERKASNSDNNDSHCLSFSTAANKQETISLSLLRGRRKSRPPLHQTPNDPSDSPKKMLRVRASDHSIEDEGEKSEIIYVPKAPYRRKRSSSNSKNEISTTVNTTETLNDTQECQHFPEELHALTSGKVITIRLIVNNNSFDRDSAMATVSLPNAVSVPTMLGNDGNQFYCQVCKGFGDVVCCDGCPRVYHHMCIPTTDHSRRALDNDDDPWFCPICMKKQKLKTPPAPVGRVSERRVKRKCTECQHSGGELVPCKSCGVWMHHPSCRISEEFQEAPEDQPSVPLCSNCRVEAVVEEEQMALEEGDDDSRTSVRKRPYDDSDADNESQNGEEYDDIVLSGLKGKKVNLKKKRKRPTLIDELTPKAKSNKIKKLKSKLRSTSFEGEFGPCAKSPPVHSDHNHDTLADLSNTTGVVKAIPAFFFFLNDSRARIERVLSRKHRFFGRLTKGIERSELVAKEGAKWWIKLRPNEQQRFMSISMQDFEDRILEWKEKKTDREILVVRDPNDGAGKSLDNDKEWAPEDQLQLFQYHHRLYLSTSVGIKAFTPEPGKSNNRVLLELLQDIRFHPLPMLSGNRSDELHDQAELSTGCISYFDVHGPVATSVGDECLGCTRGWNHSCPVLKRRLPAIEHRARLQPPISSLLATRIGLGLKPKVPDNEEDPTDGFDEHVQLFEVRETKKSKEEKLVPPIPSFTLSQPSTRVDDVVYFVEETLAMKIPEPPRPSEPILRSEHQKSSNARGRLPLTRKIKSITNGDTVSSGAENELSRCGRCRAIIRGDTGCIQCRRAQLVINTSKNSASCKASNDNPTQGRSEQELSGHVKVQTAMLGRLSAKETNFDEQSEGDRRISAAILKMRWSPCAVLPASKTVIPNRVHAQSEQGDSERDEQVATLARSDCSNEEMESVHNVLGIDSNDTPINSTSENGIESGSLRRQRSARLMAAACILSLGGDSVPITSSPDRQQIALAHKEEAKELHKRCVQVVCSGILLAMMRRDPLRLFAEPVADIITGYSTVVKTPIDFSMLRSRVLKGEYTSIGAFVSDARLLCTNSLAFNPPGSIYSKTAFELLEVVEAMQERSSDWISTIKDAHSASFTSQMSSSKKRVDFDLVDSQNETFKEIRKSWPEAVDLLETGDWFLEQLESDFVRTKENENAFYGSIAVQRAAVAAEVSLASYPNTGGVYSAVVRRSHTDDENLRRMIDSRVAQLSSSLQLKRVPTWREEMLVRNLRRIQSRRLETRVSSKNGCARCDGMQLDPDDKTAMSADAAHWGRNKRKGELDTLPRVAESRTHLTTGTASMNARRRIEGTGLSEKKVEKEIINALEVEIEDDQWHVVNKTAVSVRGSRVHGWGLFADQSFNKGAVVTEYVGEYISYAVADAREKIYQERRIQDYQFRIDETLVIDATLKGGHGRYINHSCNPSCVSRIVDGKAPDTHLKRVIIIAQRNINTTDEITYDYQFPLELDLDARIPCNCGSELCRGFMNWDLPEKGSKNSATRTQKRGGNMRDRIRRLGKKSSKRNSL